MKSTVKLRVISPHKLAALIRAMLGQYTPSIVRMPDGSIRFV